MLFCSFKWRYMLVRERKKLMFCLLVFLVVTALFYILQKKETIRVVIMEEHHEALPYWIQAAEDEVIPFSSNTLVHIDAHSDDALPEYIPDMPLFDWPEDDTQIETLLQKNDVFIMEAVMIGVVDRFIWITPAWNDETKNIGHHTEDIELGYATLRAPSDSSAEFQPYLCRCETSDNGINECIYFNYSIVASVKKGIGPEVKLHNSLCTNKKVYTFEILTAKAALATLQDEQDWFVEEESIILDIDEDYFGVELPGKALISAGISWENVEIIDDKLAAIFCPQHIEHENLGQEIIEDILQYYTKLCEFHISDVSHCKHNPKHIADKMSKDVLLNWWMNEPDLFCFQNDNQLRQSLVAFIDTLHALTSSQIAVISRIGFCFNTSPKTFAFPVNGHFVICHGNNNPDDPFVQLYKSSAVALQRDMFHLQAFLQALPQPHIVTICRSSRDGYTPRDQVSVIEVNLVRHFMAQNLDQTLALPYKVEYDDHLMVTRI